MIRRARERRRWRRPGQHQPWEVKVGEVELVAGGWWHAAALYLRLVAEDYSRPAVEAARCLWRLVRASAGGAR